MAQSKELTVTSVDIDAETLRNMNSFADAIELAKNTLGAEVISAGDLGDGYTLLEDKDKLIGLPCMFVTWRFADGDFGEFVSAHVMAQVTKNEYIKVIINDGSTGMYAQLREITDRTPGAKMLFAQRGLRRSDFKYIDDKGESKPAKTYYIDTTPVSA